MANYLEKLDQACAANHSLLCVGLDPEPSRLPLADVFEFNQAIVEATADLVCAYKPNLSFYEALGLPGLRALEQTIQRIRQAAPQAQIIGDGKRGDMGPSAAAYARAMFQVWDFDAITINGWGGADAVEPFLADAGRGAFLWCRGSNPGASDFQDLRVDSPYGQIEAYAHLAYAGLDWNQRGNLGLVVGATAPEQLAAVRTIAPDVPLLIPGVGAQGGDLAASIRHGADRRGRRAIISVSRSVIYASAEVAGFAQAARSAAQELRNAINESLTAEGKGWP